MDPHSHSHPHPRFPPPSASSSSPTPPNHTPSDPHSSSSYFTFPMTYAVSGILRRLQSDPLSVVKPAKSSSSSSMDHSNSNGNGIYTPPRRIASPFQPPPLTPLILTGWRPSTKEPARLLSRALAEEIRLLVPARLQLVDTWTLLYSLEQNGTSLSTLYKSSEDVRARRGAFVLVVRDAQSGVFGAYLSDAPRPGPHYYGTGECFLWKASTLPQMLDLSFLPPPPSADTTHAQRQTTVLGKREKAVNGQGGGAGESGTATPERIRFKAFPYSGVNDYMIFCEAGYLSVGGGDGHYGLWLDDSLDKGVSSTSLTFGNEPLSEQGSKFDIVGVEMWYIGASS